MPSVLLMLLALSAAARAEDAPQAGAALVPTLQAQLQRASEAWAKDGERPYYAAVQVTDLDLDEVRIWHGTVSNTYATQIRYLDVDLRVGSPELDSTHELRGFSSWSMEDRSRHLVPTRAGYALEHALWLALDSGWRDARQRYTLLQANRNVLAEEESPANDFELRPPLTASKPTAEVSYDRAVWVPVLVGLGQTLDQTPNITSSQLSLTATTERKTFVDTDGAAIEHGRRHLRLAVQLEGTAADGDALRVFEAVDVHDASHLPDAAALNALVSLTQQRYSQLYSAPRGEPYSGPVLLEGRAAAVFFHEVFGHRVEGHRQKRDSEGKTFAEAVGKSILPAWLDVVDDPTRETFGGVDLNGYYLYDDEGVAAAPAPLVDNGVFQGFLMSRTPLATVLHSNGHGRRSPGRAPLPRMGNTIITADKTVPRATLERMLRDELRAQGLPYAYVVEDIEGGFTITGRVSPNAFNVRATRTRRVYADGRPDEVVRGIDLVGTPLVAFGQIIAAGDDSEVFNGVCGAESGWVPVSAVAPSMLFKKLEFQRKEKGEDRPPLLSRPTPTPIDGMTDAEVPQ